jgi:ABC-type uncharacterized transport system permease subunit
MATISLHILTMLAYLAAAILYGANLSLRSASRSRMAHLWFIGGILLNTAAIGHFCLTYRESPFASTYGSLSVAAWTSALAWLLIERKQNLSAISAFILSACSLFIFGAILRFHRNIRINPEIREKIISIHVMLTLFAFALLFIASCCALCYLWQYRLLKRPNCKGKFRLFPPLETLDSMAYHLVAFALPILTLGLSFGILRAINGGLKGDWIMDPHILGSLAAWLVYLIYLLSRSFGGVRGLRSNYLILAGMAITLLLFIMPGASHRFG